MKKSKESWSEVSLAFFKKKSKKVYLTEFKDKAWYAAEQNEFMFVQRRDSYEIF